SGIAVGGIDNGGSVYLTSQLFARGNSGGAFDINTSSTDRKGGDVTISITSSDIDGVTLKTGNINTSGTSGGSVVVMSFDATTPLGLNRAPGTITIGQINTTATDVGGRGG